MNIFRPAKEFKGQCKGKDVAMDVLSSSIAVNSSLVLESPLTLLLTSAYYHI